MDARAWKVPDSPFRNEPAVEALLTLDDDTPVAYEGDWAAADRRDLVERRLGAHRAEGARDVERRASTMRCAAVVHLERYGSKRERVALPRLAAVDRLGVLHELRRAVVEGTPPETLGRGQPEEPRGDPRDRALGRRSAGRSGREDRPLPRALPRPLARRGARRRAGGRVRGGRDLDDRALTGPIAQAAERRGLEISALSCHGNPLHPDEAVARAADRELPRHGAARRGAGRRHGDHVLRLPRRVGALAPPELGHVLLAGRLPRDARVAVERARAPVLGRGGGVRARATACASRSSRTRASSSTTPRRCSGCARPPARTSASTSTRRTCSGSRSTRSPRRARSAARSSTSMPRTRASSRSGSRATASSRRGATPTSAPGSSARSATAIRSSSGASSRRALRDAGYDGALSIEHEDPLRSREDGLARAVATLRDALGPLEPLTK